MPRLLRGLGFTPAKARWLAEHIVVDPARGAGHALQAARRGDFPHLRTRVEPDGMDYKGYNIAVHEMGHNVEQVFSLYEVDQHAPRRRAEQRLHRGAGLHLPGARPRAARPGQAERARRAAPRPERLLGRPGRSPASRWWTSPSGTGCTSTPTPRPPQLREATVALARDLWNRYYAPVLGGKDSAAARHLLAHDRAVLPLPADYPLGHLIAFQLEEKLQGGRGRARSSSGWRRSVG